MTTAEYLDQCYDKFLEPLIRQLELPPGQRSISATNGSYETRGENIRLRLENDRGLTVLIIGSVHGGRAHDVELLAPLFTEWQGKRGTLRLDLDQQSLLVRSHWEELNGMFSREQFATTGKKLRQLDEARSAYPTGG